jgi:hypothetical protein
MDKNGAIEIAIKYVNYLKNDKNLPVLRSYLFGTC